MVTFTTSPIYWKPLVPRITIKSLDNTGIYYQYDPWTDSGTTTKAVACSVNLSQNHQGIFTVQIEDETNVISSGVNLGARCIIECGKQSSQMTRLISGLIRQKGHTRGADRKVLYTISGSSTAIRLNEKILYYVNEAAKLAQDNITIDINDATRKADLLLQTGLAGLTNEGVINAGGVVTSSDVENFIASLAIEYGEAQDLCNLLEEQTNGEIFVDVNDLVQFRHQLQPPTAGRGFTIKNKNATNDNADDTCYLRGRNWDYTESCMKSDSYSNRIYGILPAETVPSTREDIGFNILGATLAITSTVEVAQKFRPTHSHFLTGDIMIVGLEVSTVANQPAWPMRMRICTDSGGVPTNAGGIVANIDYLPSEFQEPSSTFSGLQSFQVLQNQIFYNSANARIDSFDLDTTKNYWLIMSNDNIPIVAGSHNNDWASTTTAPSTGTGLYSNSGGSMSTNSAGGSGWTNIAGFTAVFALPRRRAQPMEGADPKAISAIGNSSPIESTLSNTPNTIKTREAMYRYMTNQLYYMARPRVNWNMATVTAPNVPILPGDPIMISDSVMGFSAPGSQVIMTTAGDMTYSWQIGQYQAPTILSIQPVSNPTFYK